MKIPYFDAHCDTIAMGLGAQDSLRSNRCHIDLQRGRDLGRYAQIFALFGSTEFAPKGQMWSLCQQHHDRFVRELEENSDLLAFCRSGAQVDAAVSQGKIAALLSVESADLLECRIDRIETVAGWGVKMMNLTWNQANSISGSNAAECDRGLSMHGRDFVRELEANLIYADVSHLSDAGFWDLVHVAKRPIVASHSNARTICPHRRNLTDDMFRAVRDSGGIVGLNYYLPFVGENSVDALVAHVEHFLALGGERTLCIGGDLDGCDALAGGMHGLQDVHKLYTALQQRGYSQSLLEDIYWNNLRRII